MCGRFTRYLTWSEIHALYRLTAPAEVGRNTEARYNIAPTQTVDFVTVGENGKPDRFALVVVAALMLVLIWYGVTPAVMPGRNTD